MAEAPRRKQSGAVTAPRSHQWWVERSDFVAPTPPAVGVLRGRGPLPDAGFDAGQWMAEVLTQPDLDLAGVARTLNIPDARRAPGLPVGLWLLFQRTARRVRSEVHAREGQHLPELIGVDVEGGDRERWGFPDAPGVAAWHPEHGPFLVAWGAVFPRGAGGSPRTAFSWGATGGPRHGPGDVFVAVVGAARDLVAAYGLPPPKALARLWARALLPLVARSEVRLGRPERELPSEGVPGERALQSSELFLLLHPRLRAWVTAVLAEVVDPEPRDVRDLRWLLGPGGFWRRSGCTGADFGVQSLRKLSAELQAAATAPEEALRQAHERLRTAFKAKPHRWDGSRRQLEDLVFERAFLALER